MKKENFKLEECHRTLFPFAYRVLDSVEDAEDTIQDVLGTYYALVEKQGITNPKSYLIKSVINKSIDVKGRKRKMVLGTEHVQETEVRETTDLGLQLQQIATFALRILSKQLNPMERVVFILKEGFNYSHEEISQITSLTIQNSRKILSRAKSKLKTAQLPSHEVPSKEVIQCLEKMIKALKERDVKLVQNLISN